MSRSYKHTPIYKCKISRGKFHANKRIRHLSIDIDIPNYRFYKKYYETYDVIDYCFYCPLNRVIFTHLEDLAEEQLKTYHSLFEFSLHNHYKWYYRK